MSARLSLGLLRSLFLRKFFAVVLSISFVFSPLAAHAQDAGTDTPPADTGGGVPPPDTGGDTMPPPPPPPPELSIPGVDSAPPDANTNSPDSGTAPEDLTSPPASDESTPPDESKDSETPPEPESLLSGGSGFPPTISSQSLFTGQNVAPK